MSDRINIGKNVYSLEYDHPKGEYTKVRVIFDERADPVEVGTDDGRVLEINNPWAESFAEQMAQDILDRINGYYYQPFEARGAFLPDSVELGDNVIVAGIYAPIISQDTEFNALGVSDISAPNGEDKENEFGDYVPSQDNSIDRELGRIRTELIVNYDSISASVTDLTNEMGQTLRIAADGVTITNAQGSTLAIDGGQLAANSVTATEIDVSTLRVGSGGISVDSGAISWGKLDSSTRSAISGAASDAEDALDAVEAWTYSGTTYIDGTQIMTGTVTASTLQGGSVNLLTSNGYVVGSISLAYTSYGYGIGISADYGGIRILAAGNIYLESGTGTRLLLDYEAAKLGPTVMATDGTIIYSSDRNLKEDIDYDLSKYRDFLLSLKPCRFKFKQGKSGRYHTGLIAQDVEKSLSDNGLSATDFAGWCQVPVVDENGNQTGETTYGIRYDDLVSLNTMLIQELEQRISDLEARYGSTETA